MADFPDIGASNYSFTLKHNTQSYESPLTRAIQTASLSGAQWQGVATYTNKEGADARKLRAFVLGLKGQTGRFNFTPPDLNQGGALLGAPVVNGANQLGDTLTTKGWDYPQVNTVLAGDYLTVNGELKMVLADADAYSVVSYPSVTNYISSPFDPSGWYGATSTSGAITNVTMQNPSGESVVGLAEQLTADQFDPCRTIGVNNMAVVNGEYVYAAIVIKQVHAEAELILNFLIQDEHGIYQSTRVSALTGAITSTENSEVKTTELASGFLLIEMKTAVARDAADMGNRIIFWDDDSFGTPEVGTQAYVQAAFFGKNPLEYPYASYNEFDDVSEANTVGNWTGSGATLTVAGGVLSYVATNGDPQIIRGSYDFDGGVHTTTEIKWKRNSGVASIQMFWSNDSGNFSSERRVVLDSEGVTTGPDVDGFYTTVLDLSANEQWNGTHGNIQSLRLDFGNDNTSNFDIDHIKIYSPELLAAYEDYWPAVVDGSATLQIAPPLRKSPPDSAVIEVEKPYMIAKLEDDEQASFQVSGPVIYNATLAIKEAF